MQFQQHGITVSVEDEELRRLVLERLSGAAVERIIEVDVDTVAPPPIGAEWVGQGGIYAGIARGRDGGRDYHLVVGPEYDGSLDWPAAVKWAAEKSQGGFHDFALPTRREQPLLFANTPELFKAECYWSDEQLASGSVYAWTQDFDNGLQNYWLKDSKLRARLVRRLPIQ